MSYKSEAGWDAVDWNAVNASPSDFDASPIKIIDNVVDSPTSTGEKLLVCYNGAKYEL